MAITLKQAKRVLEVVDAGLSSGKGEPKPGFMCVEAAVTFALGEPFSDEPSCVASALRSFKISLNDKNWSSKEARAKGLRRIAIAQLGTKNTLDEKLFLKMLSEMTIKKIVPKALRLIALNSKFKDELLKAADKCEQEGTEEAAREANKIARAAANAAVANAAANAAVANAAAYAAAANAVANAVANAAAYAAAANAAANAVAYAAAANAAAANAVAYAAAANAAANAVAYAAANAVAYAAAANAAAANAVANAAAYAAARDQILSDYAEEVVQILIKLETPGSKFLFLTEK